MPQPLPPPQSQRFQALDSLRGLAALAVASFHLSPYLSGHWGAYVMVDFFLVLSGFVLVHSYWYGSRPQTMGSFLLRRWARLWPMHLVALLVMWGAIYWPFYGQFFAGPYNNVTTLLQNLTLTHNLGFPLGVNFQHRGDAWMWNFPSWSISVEFWVNVLFVLVLRKTTRSWSLALAAGACLGLLLWKRGTLRSYNEPIFGWMSPGMLRGIASFWLGILAYRLYLWWREHPLTAGQTKTLEALLLLFWVLLPEARLLGWIRVEFLGPLLFTPMVALFALERGPFSQGLRPIHYLGTISYSVYLNHAGIWILVNTWVFASWVPRALLMPVGLFLTLVYSHFTYRWVEVPGQRLMLRLTKRWTTPKQGVPPVASESGS